MGQSHVVRILDAATGSDAHVLVSLGFNCFGWRPSLDGGPREMLWAHPDFAGGNERPSASGIPLLFPFPGRIGSARFEFGGRTFELEPGDALGNAIHGFVLNRPWRVVDQGEDRVTGEFQASRDDPAVLTRWPSDFRIRASYHVQDCELVSDVEYTNIGERALPCGFGTHAYFRLPLAAGSEVEETLLTVPTARRWEAVDMLPTGRLLPLGEHGELARGLRLGERRFDMYFTDLAADADGRIETRLIDPASGRTVTQTFDRAFTQCVVYTPPHREAICLEPYTCVPDALRLTRDGHETGLQLLEPGESFATTIRLAVA